MRPKPVPDRRRRHLIVVGVVAAAVSVIATVWWFIWVPNWRPSLRDGERYGVDVSAHQGHVRWTQVAADRIEFAYVKATEGGDFVDARFNQNWTAVAAAGLDRGAYHFFTLCSPGEIQAQNFLKVAPPDSAALAPAVDLELAGNCSKRPPAAMVEAELDSFLRLVEAAWGTPTVLYVGDDYEARYPVRKRLARPSWRRRFLLRPDVEGWYIWQLHGYAHVRGISHGVDLNVMRRASGSQGVAPANR